MADKQQEIQRKQKRWGALKTERSTWLSHWQKLARFLLPRSGQFLVTDRNRGEQKHNHIYDSSGTRSLRVLSAGLHAGVTSPARPWFALRTPDDELNESPAVKAWLSEVAKRMRHVFSDSNTYRALHSCYRSLGAFGTVVDIVEPSFENIIHNTPLPIGSYAIAVNDEGYVDTTYREFEMSVDQIVKKFGLDSVSHRVRQLYDGGKGLDKWIRVTHAIEPRMERDMRKRDAINMPWSSCYFESDTTEGKYLRESGYRRYPGMGARWDLQEGDIYGGSPGMEALGDVKQLQHQQLRKGQGIDYQTQPPLQMPTSAKGKTSYLPGGVTYVDQPGTGNAARTLFEVQLELAALLNDIQDVRQRISRTFYEDLFLMLATLPPRSNVTATEIVERHEEKLLMLGPVLERLHNELLAPLVDITFDRMIEVGLIPMPPQELQGVELSVQFVSILAQAQKAVGLQGIDRLIGLIATAAEVKPGMLDKVDGDQVVDVYADMLGVDPSVIVADDKVAIIRQQRAEREAAMQAAAMAPEMAKTAKTLADADTSGKNALTDMARATGG